MHPKRFDAWSQVLGTGYPRRLFLASVVAAVIGQDTVAENHRRRRRRKRQRRSQRRRDRCQPAHAACHPKRPCCGDRACIDRTCCPADNAFVACPPEQLCDDLSHCCAAGEVQDLCCASDKVCGDFCCGPDEVCGLCGGISCCRCTSNLACPTGFICSNGDCLCQLPPEQCAIGGVGLVVVRRP